MLRLLRNRQTGLYWSGRDWVNDCSQAQRFADTMSLCETASDNLIGDVQEVLQFGDQPDPDYDIQLELSAPRACNSR